MKEFNLREELRTLKDKHKKQTQRHPVDVVLMITIMATIMKNIAINVLRRENHISFRQAIRMLGGKIEKLIIS